MFLPFTLTSPGESESEEGIIIRGTLTTRETGESHKKAQTVTKTNIVNIQSKLRSRRRRVRRKSNGDDREIKFIHLRACARLTHSLITNSLNFLPSDSESEYK